MRINYTYIICTLMYFFSTNLISAQQFTLKQLESTLNMSHWEEVNQYLTNKNWEYDASEKGDDYNYDNITWSYDKDYYSERALGWFYVYAYENKPQMIRYQAKKDYIISIRNSLSSNGYKLKESNIEDDYLKSTYENTKYIIELYTSSNDEDYVGSKTIYVVKLIKKSGIYDSENGEQIIYYEGTNKVKAKYVLKDSEINGLVTNFYLNGKIKNKGYWVDGVRSGKFEEYDESGNMLLECYVSNDKLNGSYTYYYPNGQISIKGNYQNGFKSGFFTEYDEDGNKESEYFAENDLLNGTYKRYYENGQVKISGTYKDDKMNGFFVEYREDGTKKIEYFREEDLLNGILTEYYENGNIEVTGYYQDGKKSGVFKEYNEDGVLVFEYNMKNDELDGVFKEYSNGELVIEQEYKNGLKSGSYYHVFYIGEEDGHKLIETGSFIDDKQDGNWKLVVSDEEGDRVLSIENYENGLRHGKFQNFQGDSLIFSNHYKGNLDGEYLIYRDLTKLFFGGIINTDTTQMVLTTKGHYSEGNKSKRWYYYGITTALLSTGTYQSDKKHGEWKYYYSKISFDDVPTEYSEKLYLIENYKFGKKDGESIRFSTLTPCDEVNVPSDSCFVYEFKEFKETINYKNDEIYGAVELIDADNQLVYRGEVRHGERRGLWIEKTDENTYEEGKYVNGQRQGNWDVKLKGERVYSMKYINDEIVESKKYINQNILYEHYKYSGDINTYYAKYKGDDNNRKIEEVKITSRNDNFVIAELSLYNSDTLKVYTYKVKSKNVINSNDCLKGQKDGMTKLLVNDYLLIKGKYRNDKKTGTWEFYYPSQNILVKLEYNNDKPLIATERYYFIDSNNSFEGDFILYNSEGKVLEERSIKEGMRNGKTIYFDKSGEKIKKEKYKDGILQ